MSNTFHLSLLSVCPPIHCSAIRKVFPKIVTLDGHDLPPPITFDLDEAGRIPRTQGSHWLNPEIKKLVCLFLDQYFKLYDSGNRQQLLDAYHDNAIYSMCVSYNKLVEAKQMSLQEYISDSRNLKRILDPQRRMKTLKQGKLNIVALLTQLPSTLHDPAAFVVDVTHASETLMSFVVHGIFKETETKTNPPYRSFSRTFVCAPQGSGMVIVNEEFTLTNATPEQIKNSFKTPAPTPSSSPVLDAVVPGLAPIVPVASPISSPGPSIPPATATSPQQQQQALVLQFSKESGMNIEWSMKCLEECEWNYVNAAKVFTDLKAKGGIPQAAFS